MIFCEDEEKCVVVNDLKFMYKRYYDLFYKTIDKIKELEEQFVDNDEMKIILQNIIKECMEDIVK